MAEIPDKPSKLKAPGSYRGVVLIIRLRLIFIACLSVALWWAALTEGPTQSRVRAAILRGAGLDSTSGTTEGLGYVFGLMLIPGLLVIAEWLLLRRRKLLPFRVIAGIDLFVALSNQSSGSVLLLLLLILSCLPSLQNYCDETPYEQAPSIKGLSG